MAEGADGKQDNMEVMEMKDENKDMAKRILNTAVDINANADNPALISTSLYPGILFVSIYPNGKAEAPTGNIKLGAEFTCPLDGVRLRSEHTLEEAWAAIMEVAE